MLSAQQAAIFASSSSHLSRAYVDIFDLYRATVPVAHADLLTSVTSIGMQLANDCLYIAREGVDQILRKLPPGRWPEEQIHNTRRTLHRLQRYASNVVDEQVVGY